MSFHHSGKNLPALAIGAYFATASEGVTHSKTIFFLVV
jgi:hypothetical protein